MYLQIASLIPLYVGESSYELSTNKRVCAEKNWGEPRFCIVDNIMEVNITGILTFDLRLSLPMYI